MSESKTEQSIEVDVPIRVAYNQWTQFEEFPKFMKGVEFVKQEGDDFVHWRVNVAGRIVEYHAQILQQIPNARIAWQSTAGKETGGVVAFDAIDANKTKVTLTIRYAPEGVLEKLGDLLGVVSAQTREDLANFKVFIEGRGQETGAWRGGIGPAEL